MKFPVEFYIADKKEDKEERRLTNAMLSFVPTGVIKLDGVEYIVRYSKYVVNTSYPQTSYVQCMLSLTS